MTPGDLRKLASMAEVQSIAPVVRINAKEARELADLWEAAIEMEAAHEKWQQVMTCRAFGGEESPEEAAVALRAAGQRFIDALAALQQPGPAVEA